MSKRSETEREREGGVDDDDDESFLDGSGGHGSGFDGFSCIRTAGRRDPFDNVRLAFLAYQGEHISVQSPLLAPNYARTALKVETSRNPRRKRV